jgi:hypothetical protein
MVVGIDIGYGYTKIYSDSVKIVFPTLVSRGVLTGDFGNGNTFITVNNVPYTVGERAKALMGNFKVTKDFVGSPSYYAVLGYALYLLKEKPSVAVLGLPPSFYDKQTIQNLILNLYSYDIRGPRGFTVPMPQKIEYIPQGTGIYYSHISNGNADYQKKNVVIIDIGYYTMDTTLFRSGEYISEAGRSYPAGICLLIDKIKSAYSKKYGSFISDSAAERLLKSRELTHFGVTHTLNTTEIIEGFVTDQLVNIIKDYAIFVKGLQETVDHVLLGGGGAAYLANYIRNITIVDEPQLANAKGFYEYAKRI